MPDSRPLAALLTDPDDALWTMAEAALVLRVAPKTASQMPGLKRVRIMGRGRRRIVRLLAGDVRRFVRESRAVA